MLSNQFFLNISFISEKDTQDSLIDQQIPYLENLVIKDSHNILFSKNFELLKEKYRKKVKSVFNFEDLKQSYYVRENDERESIFKYCSF